MINALIVDYFGTIADPNRVDSILKPLATEDSFQGIYKDATQKTLDLIIAGDKEIIQAVRDTFYPGVTDLFDAAKLRGLDTQVYSSGHGPFIVESLKLIGVETKFIDPDIIGSKKEASSYQKLKKQMKYQKIIFTTDSNAEAKAALEGEINHVVLVDPSNPDYSKVHQLIEAASALR
ncbi:hypothetical protein HOC01_05780 [archaeon]|jgi:2-hydroxy-3-keto-5-methylthiopentenyl-1-phosphate phosphatase|nr:hypothetical protein [archaeon]MBT6697649.1 hypothetical protein [archaeon]